MQITEKVNLRALDKVYLQDGDVRLPAQQVVANTQQVQDDLVEHFSSLNKQVDSKLQAHSWKVYRRIRNR